MSVNERFYERFGIKVVHNNGDDYTVSCKNSNFGDLQTTDCMDAHQVASEWLETLRRQNRIEVSIQQSDDFDGPPDLYIINVGNDESREFCTYDRKDAWNKIEELHTKTGLEVVFV